MTHCRVPDCGATTNAWLCRPCLAEVKRALDDYASMLHEVSNLATKQTRVYRANGTSHTSNDTTDAEYDEAELWEWLALPAQLRSRAAKSSLPATPTMVNLGARDLFDETVNLLSTTARDLNESTNAEWSRRVEGPRYEGVGFIVRLRGEAPDTIAALLSWLLHNIDAIRWHDGAADMHRDLTRQHSRMRRAVDRIASRVVAGPCRAKDHDGTTCERPLFSSPEPAFEDDNLRREWELDNPIVCDGYRPSYWRPEPDTPAAKYPLTDGGCGAVHERAGRREWMFNHLDSKLLPLSLLKDALPGVMMTRIAVKVPESIIDSWVTNERLVPRAKIRGVDYYCGGDLITLMLAYRPKTFARRPNRGKMSV